MITLGEIVIPCLLSVCFDDAMHGIYVSYFVNMGFRVHLRRFHCKKVLAPQPANAHESPLIPIRV